MKKVLIIGGVLVVAGVGIYLYLRNKNKSVNTVSDNSLQDESKPSSQANTGIVPSGTISNTSVSTTNPPAKPVDDFCNPPVKGDNMIATMILKTNYQTQKAMEAWEAQGRGVNPTDFIVNYIKQRCPK